MPLTVAKKPSPTHAHKPKRDRIHSALNSSHTISHTFPVSVIQRKPNCPCGGRCPRCKSELAIQTKLRIGEPGDQYEQEADRIADQVMRMPEPQVQRQPEEEEEEEELLQTKPLACQITPLVQRQVEPEEEEEEEQEEAFLQTKSLARSAIPTPLNNRSQVLKGAGQPLPKSVRTRFESRFGHDFSRVRVHTDAASGEVAQTLNARAFTLGNHIVFGRGEYAPSRLDGQRLIVHELTHVVQQSAGSESRMIRRQRRSARSKKFYQHVLDKVAELKKEIRSGKYIMQPHGFEVWTKLLALSKAVEQQQKEKIPKLLNEFIQLDPDPATRVLALPRDFLNELATRLFFMGLEAESKKIREYYYKKEKGTFVRRNVYFEKNIFWEQLTKDTLGKIKLSKVDHAKRSLDLLLRVFGAIQQEKKQLTPAALKKGNTSTYYHKLSGHLRELTGGIQQGLQVLIDRAVIDLGKGKGLKSLKPFEDYLSSFDKQLKIDERTLSLTLEVTRTDFAKRRHMDIFLKGRAAKRRSIAFKFYDVTQKEGEEKQLLIGTIRRIRYRQLKVLHELYGPTNRAAIPQLPGGRLRLNNIDDWRQFVLIKYRELKTKSNEAKALEQVIRLLERYLKAFTISTPYDILDIGGASASYLTRKFPRALTGQVIHDCGVYALRIAYILSQVRKELGLKFRFVLMPNHVSLVISGDKLPLIVAHNNTFHIMAPDKLAEVRKDWEKAKGPKGEAQFIGEIAGGYFYGRHLDFPFRVLEVPAQKRSPKRYKNRLWAFYKKMARKSLFAKVSATSEMYQFHLQYLATIGAFKLFHNNVLWRFWHVEAHQAWEEFQKRVSTAKTSKEKDAARKKYLETLKAGYTKVSREFGKLEKEHKKLTELYKKHPELKVKGIRIAKGERIATILFYFWQRELEKYLKDAEKYSVQDMISSTKKPPFEKEKNKFELIE